MIDFTPLIAILKESRRILISAHAKIDGDGLGSAFALYHALRFRGYTPKILFPDAIPSVFRFIGDDFYKVGVISSEFPEKDADGYDTLIIVDTSSRNQLQKVALLADSPQLKTVVIDHHAVAETLTEHTFADSTAPAAGCLVMELLEQWGVPLDYRADDATLSIAEYLFFAIATDTGWFRFPSVRQETFQQAARLMGAGVVPSKLYVYAYENYSPARLKLCGVVAEHVQYACHGRLAYSWVSQSDFSRLGAQYSETTDLVNTMMMTSGVEVCLLFCEYETGVRVNFRSRSDCNVAEIARSFQGGGHAKAAGATILDTLQNAMEMVLQATQNMMLTQDG
ncbi:MAG: DHH family phosphoesterase [Planctomycetia bacterium]|nr:DHH family phosphoesterase [Planctomycetia bacterium]